MPSQNDEERRKRLAQALRDNLKRRKAQARGRREVSADAAENQPQPPGASPVTDES